MLPMALPGPIYFSGGTSDALGWAHCNSSSCRQKLRFGSLSLRQMLSIPWDGPISLAAAAAHGSALAHYCSSSCCQCPREAPFHYEKLMQMALFLPIDIPADAHESSGPRIGSLDFQHHYTG